MVHQDGSTSLVHGNATEKCNLTEVSSNNTLRYFPVRTYATLPVSWELESGASISS